MPKAAALPLPGSLTPARFMALFAFLAPLLAVLSPRGEAPLLIAGSILGLGLIYALTGLAPQTRGRGAILVLALIAWGWISIAWSWTPNDGIAQGLQLTYTLVPVMLFIATLDDPVLALLDDPAEARALARKALLAGFVLALVLLAANTFGGLFIFHLLHGRITTHDDLGLVRINRSFTVMSGLVWPAAFVLWHDRRRLAAGLLPVLLLAVAVAGQSKSAKLGLSVGLVVFALTWAAPLLARRLVGLALAVLFVLAVPVFSVFHALGLQTDPSIVFSGRHRVMIWHYAGQRILEKPLFGWGLDAARNLPGGQQKLEMLPGEWVTALPLHTHSIYLQAWLELGAVGAALILALTLILLHRAGRLAPPAQPFALAAFACFMAMGCTAYGLWQTWWLSAMAVTVILFQCCAGRIPGRRTVTIPAARSHIRQRVSDNAVL